MPYKDKEKQKEAQKRYRANHLEQKREYSSNYYVAHRALLLERTRRRSYQAKMNGVCRYCGKPVASNRSNLCVIHDILSRRWYKDWVSKNREKVNYIVRKHYTKSKVDGKCFRCGAPLLEEEIIYCNSCRVLRYRQNRGIPKGVLKYETAN